MAPDGIERSRRLVLDAIGTPADLTLVSCARTAAGALATAGARVLLDGHPRREISLGLLPASRGELALLCAVEGPDDLMARALAVAQLRFSRVIVLPTRFSAHDDRLLAALARGGATVFAADPASRSALPSRSDARLAHDCALYVDYGPYARDGTGVLDAFASGGGDGDRLDADGDLEAWLATIAAHELVRTDLAPVMIAAAMLGKRVEYPNPDDERLAWIARHPLAGYPVSAMSAHGRGPEGRPAPAELDAPTRATLRMLESAALATAPPGARAGERVTAVILTRDRPRLARRALDALERAGDPAHVLVIDQNSTPAHARSLAAECAARAGVRLHRSARNLGCAGGRRLATALARSELLLFLDDDAELLPGALSHLVAALDADPGAGAVSATVVGPDGVVLHSGGSCHLDGETAHFGLIGSGRRYGPLALAPSGPADWVPGTAVLVRRALLEEFPIDDGMAAYYEDNEWCHRVARERPAPFGRSLEALVLHHLTPRLLDGSGFAARSVAVDLLAAQARFHERHGLLLGPWLFDLVPELTAADGTRDLAGARLLMELITARGPDWFLAAWMSDELAGLIGAHRCETELQATRMTLAETRDELDVTSGVLDGARRELEDAAAELVRLAGEISTRDETITWLHYRHETLLEIEQGGWWRLRERLLPLVRIAGRLRGRG